MVDSETISVAEIAATLTEFHSHRRTGNGGGITPAVDVDDREAERQLPVLEAELLGMIERRREVAGPQRDRDDHQRAGTA